MKLISVSAKRPLQNVREALRSEITSMRKEGIRVFLRESHRGSVVALRCDARGSDRTPVERISSRLKSVVANALADVIIDEYEETLVSCLVDENYSFLSGKDREAVKRAVLKKLDDGMDLNRSVPKRQQRKSMVWAKIVEYLDKEDDVILEGFVTFRLKEYLEYLAGTVQSVAEDYLTRREYREFLKLLRYFMNLQDKPIPMLNVIRKPGGYDLLDIAGEILRGEVEKLATVKSVHPELTPDDLLVSIAVTLSPEKLVWHGPAGDSQAHDLLKDLFGERFSVCPGCAWDGESSHGHKPVGPLGEPPKAPNPL